MSLIINAGGGGGTWGGITGTLSDQTDLQNALNAKVDTSSLSDVATSGDYADLTNTPNLGTMSEKDATDYTPTASLSTVALSNDYTDLDNKPSLGSLAALSSINNTNWSGADLSVSNGGTGASTASDARNNLGLVIGTDVQAQHPNLQEIASLTDPGADRILFWDDSAKEFTHLSIGTNLSISGTTLNAAGGGGGGGAVDSVNDQTGVVVLDADDIDDTSTTHKFVTATDLANLSNLSGTNTGDQDLSGLMVKSANLSDVANASTARTNLGVAIGSDVQAYNANLTTWAGKTVPTGAVIGTTDTQTLTNKDLSNVNNTYRAASTTQTGAVELATSAEINTGTDSTRAMPVNQFVASKRNVRHIIYRVLENGTPQAVGTVVGGDLVCPIAGTIIDVYAFVDTAGVTGTATYDIKKNGTTIMSTNKIRIETGEKTSKDATTQPSITTSAIAVGDILTFDIVAVQSGTVAKGLTFVISIRES